MRPPKKYRLNSRPLERGLYTTTYLPIEKTTQVAYVAPAPCRSRGNCEDPRRWRALQRGFFQLTREFGRFGLGRLNVRDSFVSMQRRYSSILGFSKPIRSAEFSDSTWNALGQSTTC